MTGDRCVFSTVLGKFGPLILAALTMMCTVKPEKEIRSSPKPNISADWFVGRVDPFKYLQIWSLSLDPVSPVRLFCPDHLFVQAVVPAVLPKLLTVSTTLVGAELWTNCPPSVTTVNFVNNFVGTELWTKCPPLVTTVMWCNTLEAGSFWNKLARSPLLNQVCNAVMSQAPFTWTDISLRIRCAMLWCLKPPSPGLTSLSESSVQCCDVSSPFTWTNVSLRIRCAMLWCLKPPSPGLTSLSESGVQCCDVSSPLHLDWRLSPNQVCNAVMSQAPFTWTDVSLGIRCAMLWCLKPPSPGLTSLSESGVQCCDVSSPLHLDWRLSPNQVCNAVMSQVPFTWTDVSLRIRCAMLWCLKPPSPGLTSLSESGVQCCDVSSPLHLDWPLSESGVQCCDVSSPLHLDWCLSPNQVCNAVMSQAPFTWTDVSLRIRCAMLWCLKPPSPGLTSLSESGVQCCDVSSPLHLDWRLSLNQVCNAVMSQAPFTWTDVSLRIRCAMLWCLKLPSPGLTSLRIRCVWAPKAGKINTQAPSPKSRSLGPMKAAISRLVTVAIKSLWTCAKPNP